MDGLYWKILLKDINMDDSGVPLFQESSKWGPPKNHA